MDECIHMYAEIFPCGVTFTVACILSEKQNSGEKEGVHFEWETP